MEKINVFRLRAFFDLQPIQQEQIQQLQDWNLIPKDNTYFCPQCKEGLLKLEKDQTMPDGYRWRCGNKAYSKTAKGKKSACRKAISLRHGTFFDKSKLSIGQILSFANLWVGGATQIMIASQIETSERTCQDFASFCREVVFYHFMLHPEKIGGPGKVVEIDESKFGKRKYHRGHRVEGQWVFGGIERESGRIFMETVEHRGADTLVPIIQKWILPGTTIVSDYWKAYDCLNNMGYQHLKVNHSINFVDPDTGAHTNTIEASWRAAKSALPPSGRVKIHIPGNLARYMFIKKCSTLNINATIEFYKLAGILYNPLCPQVDNDDEILDNTDSD